MSTLQGNINSQDQHQDIAKTVLRQDSVLRLNFSVTITQPYRRTGSLTDEIKEGHWDDEVGGPVEAGADCYCASLDVSREQFAHYQPRAWAHTQRNYQYLSVSSAQSYQPWWPDITPPGQNPPFSGKAG